MKTTLTTVGLLFSLLTISHAAPAQDLSTIDNVRAWNARNCALTKDTKFYTALAETMSFRLGVDPSRISINRLTYIPEGEIRPLPETRGVSADNTCWATFYTQRGAMQCMVHFGRNKIIWRADCPAPVGQVCMQNDCRPLNR